MALDAARAADEMEAALRDVGTPERAEPEDLGLLERLVRASRTWALRADDGDHRVRRAALPAWLVPLTGGAPPDRFAAYADASLDEKELFIRTAIGRVPRETAKRRPEEVFAWMAPRTARASGVTVREVVKPLAPEQRGMTAGPDAVVLDLDGVLVDSEERWDAARRSLVADRGGRWKEGATEAMLGMSAPEWSAYVRDELGVDLPAPEIDAAVVERLLDAYRDRLPLLPGAVESVRALAARWPLGLASSSNAPVIALVLDRAGIAECLRAWVSSEEVARGKPAPDVYLEAARRLRVAPARCVAVEDSSNGIRAAAAAGMAVVAVPMAAFPPSEDALALAAVTVEGIADVTPGVVERAFGRIR